ALSLRHEACIVLFQGAWIVSVWIATSLTRGSARRSGSRSAFQATELEAAMFRNLLLTTDFSEVARSAYRPALDLARGLGANLRLVHVLEPLPPHYYVSLEGGGVSLPMADYAVEVKKRLESEASHEAFDGAEIPTEL